MYKTMSYFASNVFVSIRNIDLVCFLCENLENLRSFFKQHKRKVLILNNENGKFVEMSFLCYYHAIRPIIIKHGSFPPNEINRGNMSYSLGYLCCPRSVNY